MTNKKNKSTNLAKIFLKETETLLAAESTKGLPLLIITACLLSLATIAIFTYHFVYSQRIYPGISIDNIHLGNKTKEEAIKILEDDVKQKQVQTLILVGPDRTWKQDLSRLGFNYQIEESVNQAYQIGRGPSFIVNIKQIKNAWFAGINLPFFFEINRFRLEEEINKIANSLFIPTISPQFRITQTENREKAVVIEPGKPGREIKREQLISSITNQLSSLENKSISIPITITNPQITENESQAAQKRAEKFLNKTLKLNFKDRSFSLSDKELIIFLSPHGNYNEEEISNYTINLANSLYRPAQSAAFQFVGSDKERVAVFKPDAEGAKVNQNQLRQAIINSLTKLENDAENETELTIPYQVIEPKIKAADVNNLGIKKLLGRGISFFRDSISSRVHNITLASSRLNGILIAPGETFSFNNALGDVSKETGYKEAYIIKEGRTVLGDGGGVCQVSTTLFRAALASGLSIEERYPHAYRVSYYEQGPLPGQEFPKPALGQDPTVGIDATVFSPGVDLKIKNNTPAYILIQSTLDSKNGTLVFELYGTSDGRSVSTTPTRVWDKTPPPPSLYRDDPTLPKGTVKQVEKAIWGSKTAFDWKVTRNGEIIQEETFYSAYRSWQAVYLQGSQ